MTTQKACAAYITASKRCPYEVVATYSLPVPLPKGGVVSGATCRLHGEMVQRMVREEVQRRVAAAKPLVVAAP